MWIWQWFVAAPAFVRGCLIALACAVMAALRIWGPRLLPPPPPAPLPRRLWKYPPPACVCDHEIVAHADDGHCIVQVRPGLNCACTFYCPKKDPYVK